jgi:phosphoheptose isomerase
LAALTEALEPRRLLAAQPYHWPAGAETLVNSYTTFRQITPSMAMDADGDYVVAWTSEFQDGSSLGVYAQRFNSAGLPQGGEFRVNTTTTDAQWHPSVAIDADGDFVVAWHSGYIGYYGYDADVYAQRYNASGVPQGAEFRVNTLTTGNHYAPSVAMDADGDFVVTWATLDLDEGLYAQRYNAAGVPQGTEFRVNFSINGRPFTPSAAMDASGDFVIAWSNFDFGYNYDIYAQRYNATGVAQGTGFRVNSHTTSFQRDPSIALDADGDFVVTWQSYLQDGSYWGVYAQRYNAAGVKQGTEFRVNTQTAGSQDQPSAAMDPGGDFVITWKGFGDIKAQRYSAAGAALGTEFRVNTFTPDNQLAPSAAMDSDGDFVVTWNSRYHDGSGDGVYFQRYTTFGPASGATIGDRVWNDSNANGIQDGGEAAIAGVTVELYSASGVGVASVTTSPTGLYSFAVLAGASAFLHFVTPAGFLPTHKDRGANDALDSDADRLTGLTPVFATGAAGTTNTSFDAGFCLPGSVSGVAFNDRSGDGIRNGGEEVLAGFHVFLDLDGDGALDPGEPNGATGVAGDYAFGGLLGDTYRLGLVDQVQWVEPALSPFLVVPGATTPINLGLRTSAPDSIRTAQGPEFRVNSFTTEVQSYPATAMDADGNFVVTWSGRGQGDNDGVFAQRYNAAGVAQGGEFRVNTTTSGNQWAPTVAMDDDGDFVVAWANYGLVNGYGIFAQRFNAAGVKQGSELPVSQFAVSAQRHPAIAMDADGDFVVAWACTYGQPVGDANIFARRYNAAGVLQGDQFTVNSIMTFDDISPSVAMDADGDFVVGWRNRMFDLYIDPADEILVRRYDAAGAPRGAEFVVGTAAPPDGDEGPSLAMDDDGDFVISWTGYDPYWTGISAQRYSAAGLPQGTEFGVNTYTTGAQSWPSAVMDASGDFTITWASAGQDGSLEGIYAQRFNAAGLRQGTEFRVNSHTSDYQQYPAAAIDADGDFVVAWHSNLQDGNSFGVYAQRYIVSQRPAITSSQFIWQNSPQRIEFIFDQDVSASITASDLVLQNLTTGATIPTGSIVRTWNAATNTASFTFPTLPNGGSLPDGTYRATLPAAGVTNPAGTSIAVDYALQFFFIAGDANHDGSVKLDDFNILATNFGLSGKTFSEGNFNYDPAGLVNSDDFNILAARFGMSLGPAAATLPAPFSRIPLFAGRARMVELLDEITTR